ncbi:histidine phosphatase family protein [Cellulomonas sp. GbtcB1]|jgi:2,3-bisphosphoglycerate-dependent phosphoglycerate mutase|uniref:histidine phosphatase family protein n=1 Tax=unclassified Cellulomonas TaxID=2620175 RepID=UPI001C30707D|nr:histidine phosphatase family protein [Cellulomonas sp. GbtcB1]
MPFLATSADAAEHGPTTSLDDGAAPDGTTTLYLVRHGRTEFNTARLLQGWSDSPLTADGLAGVRATARVLADRTFAAAYASPAGRTVATARELLTAHPGVGLTTDPGLREMHFGDLEARPEAELLALGDPVELFGGILTGTYPGLPGAERTTAYLERVADAFGRIEREHAGGGDVLVVSHGVTLLAYLAMAGTVPMDPLANASVSTVRIGPDGEREVRTFGYDPAAQGAPGLPVPGTEQPVRSPERPDGA